MNVSLTTGNYTVIAGLTACMHFSPYPNLAFPNSSYPTTLLSQKESCSKSIKRSSCHFKRCSFDAADKKKKRTAPDTS